MIIAIDGVAASGKTTISTILAKRLNFFYLYTGLLYRAVSYILVYLLRVLSENCTLTDVAALDTTIIQSVCNGLKYIYTTQSIIMYNNIDITPQLYHHTLDTITSIVAQNSTIRTILLDLQRHIAASHDVIVEGRDCGTVLFPNANIKFFFTADITVRTQRLLHDTKRLKINLPISFDKAKQDLISRDNRDYPNLSIKNLENQGYLIIDSSKSTTEQIVDTLQNHIKNIMIKKKNVINL